MKDAVRAFASQDLELARGLKERDRQLDQMNRDFAEKLTDLMSHHVDCIPTYMDLIFISRGSWSESVTRRPILAKMPSTR